MPDRTVSLEITADQAVDALRRILPAIEDYVVEVSFVDTPETPFTWVIGKITEVDDDLTVELFPWDDSEDRPDRADGQRFGLADIATFRIV